MMMMRMISLKANVIVTRLFQGRSPIIMPLALILVRSVGFICRNDRVSLRGFTRRMKKWAMSHEEESNT